MSTANTPHMGLQDAKDHWTVLVECWGCPVGLSENPTLSTKNWLLLRDWVKALEMFVRRVVILAALAIVLTPPRARIKRAEAAASMRRPETSDPVSWRVRFAMPTPKPLQSASPRRSLGRRSRLAANYDAYREPESPFAMRREPPPSWVRREKAHLRRLKAEARRAGPPPVASPRRAPTVRSAAAPPLQNAIKLARRIEAMRRVLVRFEAAAMRFARRIERNRKRNAAQPEAAQRAFMISSPKPGSKTFGDTALRSAFRRIETAFLEAARRFNNSS